MMKLKVHRAKAGDIYRDIIRVPEIYRQDSNQETIPEGTICGVTINGIQAYALIRGLGDSLKQEIDIDERLRNRFGVKINDEIEVHLSFDDLRTIGRAATNRGPLPRLIVRCPILTCVKYPSFFEKINCWC